MKIDRIDHIVLTVKNIHKTFLFYETILGMEVLTFGNKRKALKFGQQKINLHQEKSKIKPHALGAQTGTLDICLITKIPLKEIRQHILDHDITLELTPASTFLLQFYDKIYPVMRALIAGIQKIRLVNVL